MEDELFTEPGTDLIVGEKQKKAAQMRIESEMKNMLRKSRFGLDNVKSREMRSKEESDSEDDDFLGIPQQPKRTLSTDSKASVQSTKSGMSMASKKSQNKTMNVLLDTSSENESEGEKYMIEEEKRRQNKSSDCVDKAELKADYKMDMTRMLDLRADEAAEAAKQVRSLEKHIEDMRDELKKEEMMFTDNMRRMTEEHKVMGQKLAERDRLIDSLRTELNEMAITADGNQTVEKDPAIRWFTELVTRYKLGQRLAVVEKSMSIEAALEMLTFATAYKEEEQDSRDM